MRKERERLDQNKRREKHWYKWGPYLSERQWGTVREDYSPFGTPWQYFPFEQSSYRTYRWGEDGIAGISDNHQKVCFAFAFWNGKDEILKERLFGLAGGIGNHGEDVKEYYYYLDNTPTHSYMKYLYKYVQEKYPYEELIEKGRNSTLKEPEYELIDTGIFDQDNYFDIFIEYAKEDDRDILVELTVHNRSEEKRDLHVLPTLWLRNTWSWTDEKKPSPIEKGEGRLSLSNEDRYHLYFEGDPEALFTENETNYQKVEGKPNKSPYTKEAFHEYVIKGNKKAVNPDLKGTKSALHYKISVPAGEKTTLRLRLSNQDLKNPFEDFEKSFEKRKSEADEFYEEFKAGCESEELINIQRQAFGSLLWTKQFYHYVVSDWIEGDSVHSSPATRKKGRNESWDHLYNDDILSMPDKWEYPWFASWDLAFHVIPLAVLDPEFAKRQLTLFTREWYMHPNGQIPAYEWNFSDVNPPVHAWAAWRVYKIGQKKHGAEDRHFLSSIFQKLLLNFTWWVNRKDQDGKNVFQGGFLGLDNISIFNRSEQLPTGGSLTQSDATSWMAMYCLNMLTISMELATKDPSYEDMASKFFEHFLYISDAINYQKEDMPSLWNEEDGFYYDMLHLPDGQHLPIKVRSLVGLIPLLAVATIEEEDINNLKGFKNRFEWFIKNKKGLCREVACLKTRGDKNRHILSILDKNRLVKILKVMLDEKEFLSPYGIRSVSKFHQEKPYILETEKGTYQIDYEPGVSTTKLFGGNSNWRGPIWFPLNFLIIESLQKFHHYYGDELKVECPTGSGNYMTLWEIAGEISSRLIRIFVRDEKTGERPVYKDNEKFQNDPNFKDYYLFFEYFHGDLGEGLGASHQTGWTSIIAKLILQYGHPGS